MSRVEDVVEEKDKQHLYALWDELRYAADTEQERSEIDAVFGRYLP